MISVDITVKRGDFNLIVREQLPLKGGIALFGPSGSGKSTLLRILAGFEPASGRIELAGKVLMDSAKKTHIPPHKRNIGYMNQDSSLFKHLSVHGNLKYAAHRSRNNRSQSFTLDKGAGVLGLNNLLQKRPDQLSGGEVRRVGLGQTLLTNPILLLLDEPLTGLDQKKKDEILSYLKVIPQELGIPIIYVSHSPDEITTLTERMLMLVDGKVVSSGQTLAVMSGLAVQEAMGAYDAGVVIETTVIQHDLYYRLTKLEIADQTLVVPINTDFLEGEKARIRIRSRDVSIANQAPEKTSIRNILNAQILEITKDLISPNAGVLMEIGGQRLWAQITRMAVDDMELRTGQQVTALIKSMALEP